MLDYTVETKDNVQAVVDKLQAKLKENNFGVLHIYNLKEIFKSKGIEFSEYQILSVCNPKFAKEALDTNLKVGALLPCKISVYDDSGTTRVALMRPSEAIALLEDDKLNALAKKVEEILVGVVNSVK
ncbi:MAG: DUF302 domain-containing protein [Candidatus Omnitrophica bacterium]|nr:DUF302 domain-containing protein [Candidatus Omnitrophota bacterium]